MFFVEAWDALMNENPKQNGHQEFQVPKMEESWNL